MILHLVKVSRAYPPDTVSVMTVAFELVCQSLPKPISDDEVMRKKIALLILHGTDEGERDPRRLANVALQQIAGNDHSEVRDSPAAVQQQARSSQFSQGGPLPGNERPGCPGRTLHY